MPYKINKYIADTRIATRGRNLEQLFTDVFLGMMYVLKPVQKFSPEKREREISLESMDTTALLTDFLNEVLSLANANRESYTQIIFYKIQPESLRAKLFGFSIESFHKNIKIANYHSPEVKQTADGMWETTVVLNE